ncbi:MAG TPA: hypothetical protein VJ692_14040 [Nitrospiraceae bacterium]|nr:hypothetical protein [Nitrospiraceae bacterium]
MIHESVLRKALVRVLLIVGLYLFGVVLASAETGTEFPGTVLAVDAAAGKLTMKKEGSGTRFTFVVNEKTQFSEGVKGLADLKKGDNVNVTYSVVGSQYIAQKITKGK